MVFLGVVLSYILTLRFLEALSEGRLWLDSAWAFDAFYWISLLFPRVRSLPWSWWPLKKSQGNCWGWILHSPSSIENCMLWHCPTFFPAWLHLRLLKPYCIGYFSRHLPPSEISLSDLALLSVTAVPRASEGTHQILRQILTSIRLGCRQLNLRRKARFSSPLL